LLGEKIENYVLPSVAEIVYKIIQEKKLKPEWL